MHSLVWKQDLCIVWGWINASEKCTDNQDPVWPDLMQATNSRTTATKIYVLEWGNINFHCVWNVENALLLDAFSNMFRNGFVMVFAIRGDLKSFSSYFLKSCSSAGVARGCDTARKNIKIWTERVKWWHALLRNNLNSVRISELCYLQTTHTWARIERVSIPSVFVALNESP